MSVINQMLRDLEDRESQPRPERAELAAIEGIAAPDPGPSQPRRRIGIALGGLALVLVFASGASWYALDNERPAELGTAVPSAMPAPLPAEPATLPPAAPTPAAAEAAPEPLRLVGLRHSNGGDESMVALRISGELDAAPVMEIGEGQGRIQLPGVAVDGVEVGDLDDPRIRRFVVDEDGETLQVSYATAPGIRVKVATERSADGEPIMTLAFAGVLRQAPPAPAPAPSRPRPAASVPEQPQTAEPAAASEDSEPAMTKRVVPVSPKQRAESLFRQAAADLRDGRRYSAEAKLRGALREQPGHVEAARVLGALLSADGRTDEAEAILARGLRLNPDSVALAQADARLKLRLGEPAEAARVLESVLPRAQADAEYLALLATAYQRAERYGRSAELFRSALRLRPDTAVWWAGLGIALEADQRSSEALAAYQRSAELGGLEDRLARYIQARLEALTPEG
ncbi:MAG: tetratricopeptide repeat protein [Chromatiales bacterium]|jgi:MSHA biogenesis protein MshN